MAKGEIAAIRDIALNLADPMTMTHKEVQFRIDGQGPYVLYLPIEQYTAEKAIELVLKKVKEWSQVVGKALEQK